MTKKHNNKRAELAARRPLSHSDITVVVPALLKAPPERIERFVRVGLTYDMARQLCHVFGIRCIKGNCRKVLARRVFRITTLPQNAALKAVLLKVYAPEEVQHV